MRASRLPALCAALFLGAPAALLAAAQEPALALEKPDEAGDVVEVRAQGGAPTIRRVEGHDDVDLLAAASRAEGDELVLTLRVAGAVRTEGPSTMASGEFAGFEYQAALDVRAEQDYEFRAVFAGGHARLEDREGRHVANLTAAAAEGTLVLRVPLSLLGGLERFDFTASAAETRVVFGAGAASMVTYADVVGPHPDFEHVFRASQPSAAPTTEPSPSQPAIQPEPQPSGIDLVAPGDRFPEGVTIRFQLVNTGSATLNSVVEFGVASQEGREAHRFVSPSTVELRPGEAYALSWDQRDASGAQVPPGSYVAGVRFAGFADMEFFAIGARSTPPPAEPQPTPPSPPAPPAPTTQPSGEQPLVGELRAEDGSVEGQHVAFRLDAEERVLRDVRVRGVLLLEELRLPGRGAASLSVEGPVATIRAEGVEVVVHDTPAAALLARVAGGAQFFAKLPEGLAYQLVGQAALLGGMPPAAVLTLARPGSIEESSDYLAASVQPFPEAYGFLLPALLLRAVPAPPLPAPGPAAGEPPGPGEPARAGTAAAAVAVAVAIAEQRVAAEAFVSASQGAPELSVVAYAAEPVEVRVARAEPRDLAFDIEVASTEGRTLVFHIGRELLPVASVSQVVVRFDGEVLEPAAGIEDVLDPDDDGLRAEFLLTLGAEGAELLVSVPHFSPHTLEVQGFAAEGVRGLAPYGVALAGLAVAAAALVMFRRNGRNGGR